METLWLAPCASRRMSKISSSALSPIPYSSAMSISRNRVAHRPLRRDVHFGRITHQLRAANLILGILDSHHRIN